MNNPNSASADNKRNDNAEWAILKEMASAGARQLSWRAEMERSEEEREKYRVRGEKILRVIGRMPDKLPAADKARQLDQIHRIAEGIGVGKDLRDALERGQNNTFGEKVGRETFGNKIDDTVELTADELERVEKLREKVLDMTEMEPGALAEAFPSGNFLYHGSTVGRIEKILRTGGLKNGVALAEDDPEASALNMNSGFEGVSWSMNQIDALPGTRGHLAGFVAAPETILSEQEKLVVPSRPAPYEVLQVAEGLEPQETYRLKTQAETWGDCSASFGEKNNVDSNFMWMQAHNPDSALLQSSAYTYEGSMAAEDLRKYFSFDERGKVVWDENLYQKGDVPPVLPYLQSILDRNLLKQLPEYGDLDTVEKILAKTREDKRLLSILQATGRNEGKPANEAYEKALDAAQAVRIRPEEMYFVTSHKDLEDWLKVMARLNVEPKGILLYDDAQVIFENFASQYDGNHEELGAEIGRVVGVDEDFWPREMGMDPAKMSRSGSVGQVLLESEVKRDKVLRVRDGELVIE